MPHTTLIIVNYFVLTLKKYIFAKSRVTLIAQQHTGMTGFDSV